MDAFERIMKQDLQKAGRQPNGSSGARHPPSSTTKEPTQAILYGYSSSTQWAAISFYETVSAGIICEDFEREPPFERRKFPSRIDTASKVHRRALTQAERALARQYQGGNCWTKVTFDSAEACDRAVASSPHLLQGHWVYAEPFFGSGPEFDEPMPIRDEDREQGRSSAPRPAYRPSRKVNSSFSGYQSDSRRGANPSPLSFTGNTTTDKNGTYDEGQAATLDQPSPARNPNFFTHFPSVPRTVLRPADEAFLPHQNQSWFEATLARLSNAGWLPNMIGDVLPLLENGEFDWAHASVYWKIFYWADSHFGTDFCGMRDE